MGKQQGLSIENVRAVFHLLNDLRDLGVQPQIWKQHMLCGLCRLIAAGNSWQVVAGEQHADRVFHQQPAERITHGRPALANWHVSLPVVRGLVVELLCNLVVLRALNNAPKR